MAEKETTTEDVEEEEETNEAESPPEEERKTARGTARLSAHFAEEADDLEEDFGEDENNQNFLQRCLNRLCRPPSMELMFPKRVNVANRRLDGLSCCLHILVFVGLGLVMMDNISGTVKPDVQVSLCGKSCELSAEQMDAIGDEGMASGYCGTSEGTYGAMGCSQRCGRDGTHDSCIRPPDLLQVRGEEVFVPTFYRESSMYLNESCSLADFSVDASASTPPGLVRCERQKDYYVPGAEKMTISFAHYFSVTPTFNLFAGPAEQMKAHTGSFHSKGWDLGLKTVLLSNNGTILRTIEGGSHVFMTVQELLAAAYYEGADGDLGLDSTYQPDADDTTVLPIRLTGVAVMMDIWISSTGMCEIHHSSEMRKVPINHLGPLACLTVSASRRWVTDSMEQPVGMGGVRSRVTSGVQVRFRKLGLLSFTDEQAIIRNLTAFIVWLQLPLLIASWFMATCLGRLSSVYSPLLYQDVELVSAIKGFSVRLLHYSSAFMGMRSKTGVYGGADGLTKKALAERIAKLCECLEIDELRIVDAVNVLFSSLKSYKKENEKASKVVTCQEFCAACATNEPIGLETMVKIFDKDRKLGKLEAIFLDEGLNQVRQAALADEGMEAEAEEIGEEQPKQVDADASHSRIVQACGDVQQLFKDLFKLEYVALKVAKDLDVNPKKLGLTPHSGLRGDTKVPKVPTGNILPKMTRSVSKDSIGDEGSHLKRDFRDIER